MKLLILYLSVSIQFVSLGQEHPIDVENKACHNVDSNQTTYGMIRCESIARDAWEAEMNKYLNLLTDTLSPNAGTLLLKAQETWLTYQEKEQAFSTTLYYSEMQGSLWRLVNAQSRKIVYRNRALALKLHYENYKGE